MKRFYFLLVCSLISAQIFSQMEVSKDLFPTLADLQRTSFHEYTDECYNSYSVLTAPAEAEIINNKSYVSMNGYYLREENNQVLVYSSAYEKDFVLYDWTLEVGDSIPYLSIDSYSYDTPSVVDYMANFKGIDKNNNPVVEKLPLDKIVVTEVTTTTLLDGNEYKKWVFNTGHTYVEGIGSLSSGNYFHVIIPDAFVSCYRGEHLVCISRGDQLLYTMDESQQQRFGAACRCLNEGVESAVEDIVIPEPTYQKILQDGQLLIIHEGNTYNVMGMKVK